MNWTSPEFTLPDNAKGIHTQLIVEASELNHHYFQCQERGKLVHLESRNNPLASRLPYLTEQKVLQLVKLLSLWRWSRLGQVEADPKHWRELPGANKNTTVGLSVARDVSLLVAAGLGMQKQVTRVNALRTSFIHHLPCRVQLPSPPASPYCSTQSSIRTQSEEIPNFQTSRHKSEASVEQHKASYLGFPVLRCVSLWIQWILPFWQALLEPVIDSGHGQVTVTLCMGMVTFPPNFFSKCLIVLVDHMHTWERKTRLQALTRKVPFFLNLPFLFPRGNCCPQCVMYPCTETLHTHRHIHWNRKPVGQGFAYIVHFCAPSTEKSNLA